MIDRSPPAASALDLSLAVGAATDVGGRAGNEDAIYVGELATLPPAAPGGAAPAPAFLLAVADGMGGHADGEVASRLAIDSLVAAVGNEPGPDAGLLLKQAFRRANEAIYDQGGGEGERAMGTTLVAALLRGKYATIAGVGDSRAYLLRANALTQVTKDHSVVEEQVAQGTLSRDQARRSPQRHVLTHVLGTAPKLENRLPAVFELTLLPEDRLLLCTDGFFDVLDDREMADVLRGHAPAAAAQRLVDLAKERGTTDNVSAVVAEAVPTRVQAVSVGAAPAAGRAFSPLLILLIAVVLVALVAAALLLFANF